jgi:hypothetical protein
MLFFNEISAGERLQTLVLDRSATGIGTIFKYEIIITVPIPVAEKSKARVCGRSPAGIDGSKPDGGTMFFVSYALSGRGLVDGLIPRPEESYRLWCILLYDQMQ